MGVRHIKGGGLIEKMVSMWEQESFPYHKDYIMVILFAVLFPFVRLLLDGFFFERLARRCIFPRDADKMPMKKKVRLAGEKKVSKFTESAWKLTYYFAAEFALVLFTRNEPWLGKTEYFWNGWPHHTIKFKLKVLYAVQCGFYVYSTAALVVWETRRKDFGVMMTHHVITICLMGYSYIDGSYRAGVSTLLLHDVTDVFLEGAKLFKYSNYEVGATVCFGLFVLSWFLLRLIIFPVWIIWSISVEALQFIDPRKKKDFYQYYVQNTLLITLLNLHIYWWILIWRMLIRQLKNRGKVGEDIRSDSEDED